MSLARRYVYCVEHRVWMSTRGRTPAMEDEVLCPLGGERLANQPARFGLSSNDALGEVVPLAMLGPDLLTRLAGELATIEATDGFGYSARIARAAHGASETLRQPDSSSKARGLAWLVFNEALRVGDALGLPATALFGLHGEQVEPADERVTRAIQLETVPIRAFAVDRHDVAREFDPVLTFRQAALVAAASSLPRESPARREAAAWCRRRLAEPCTGEIAIRDLLFEGPQWAADADDVRQIMTHACGEPAHHHASAAALIGFAAAESWDISEQSLYEAVSNRLDELDERLRPRLSDDLASLRMHHAAVRLLLDIANRPAIAPGKLSILTALVRQAGMLYMTIKSGSSRKDALALPPLQIRMFLLDEGDDPRAHAKLCDTALSAASRILGIYDLLEHPVGDLDLDPLVQQIRAALGSDGAPSTALRNRISGPLHASLKHALAGLNREASFASGIGRQDKPEPPVNHALRGHGLTIDAYVLGVAGGLLARDSPVLSAVATDLNVEHLFTAAAKLGERRVLLPSVARRLATFAHSVGAGITRGNFWGRYARRVFALEAYLLNLRARVMEEDDHRFDDEKYDQRVHAICVFSGLNPRELHAESELAYFPLPGSAVLFDPEAADDVLSQVRDAFAEAEDGRALHGLIGNIRLDNRFPLHMQLVDALIHGLHFGVWEGLPFRPIAGALDEQWIRSKETDLASPVALELVLGGLFDILNLHGRITPRGDDLGELLALLRRDLGLGLSWHGGGGFLYWNDSPEPRMSLMLLAQMSRCIRRNASLPAALDVDLIATVRGALALLAVGAPHGHYDETIRSRYMVQLGRIIRKIGLPIKDLPTSEVYFPESLLPVLAESHHSLWAHVCLNPPASIDPGIARLDRKNRVARMAFWFWGSRIWKGQTVNLEHIKRDASITRHRVAQEWLRLILVIRDEAGCWRAHDALDHAREDDATALVPDLVWQGSQSHQPDDVAYVYSVALHDTDRIGAAFAAILGDVE